MHTSNELKFIHNISYIHTWNNHLLSFIDCTRNNLVRTVGTAGYWVHVEPSLRPHLWWHIWYTLLILCYTCLLMFIVPFWLWHSWLLIFFPELVAGSSVFSSSGLFAKCPHSIRCCIWFASKRARMNQFPCKFTENVHCKCTRHEWWIAINNSIHHQLKRNNPIPLISS